jgi:hypothetical protein
MKRMVSPLNKLTSGKGVHAVFVLSATTAITIPEQTFKTLHSFNGTDGAARRGAGPDHQWRLVRDGALLLSPQRGAVFKITPTGYN